VIRFSAALVVVAIGVLIAGVAASSLPFVYVAIGISAVALLVLAAGVVFKRDELFDEEAQAAAGTPVAGAQPAADGAPAGGANVGGASQPRVAAGVGGSVSGSTISGDAAFSRDAALSRDAAFSGDAALSRDAAFSGDGAFSRDGAFSGGAAFGDWASTRYAQPAPAQQEHDGTPGRAGAWPPSAPGVVAAGDTFSGTPAPIPPASFRRPPAPPTRADPVLPWADSLPTRVDVSGTPRTPTGDAGSSSPGSSAGLPANGLLPGGKFAWRDITWDDSAGDKPRAGERDSGERDGGEPESATIATTASAVPPASTATPSWLDDVDDASDATLSLGRPGPDDNSSFPVGEADDLLGSGNASHDWLSGDDGDALTEEAAPDHPASGVSENDEAAANDAGAAADAVGTGSDVDLNDVDLNDVDLNDVDLDVTAAMPIQPGPDADTQAANDTEAAADAVGTDDDVDLDATAAMDILPGLDADSHADLDADAGPAWAALDADADPDADADLHADAARGGELPVASDEGDLAPGDPAVAETAAVETITPETAETGSASDTGQVTVVPGVPRYHDGDCILIRFMADEDVQRMTVSEAAKAGCTPCRACQPED
jgi:hypothetical protein